MLINLSQAELDVLSDILRLELPGLSVSFQDGAPLLALSEEVADAYRDKFMDQLEISGFDIDYQLTPRGVILESLIDKFFTG